MFAMLNRAPMQVSWTEVQPGRNFSLIDTAGNDSGICATPFSLGNRYPAYVSPLRTDQLRGEEASLGIILEASGRRLAYLPAVPAIDDALLQRLESADLLLFDGTFWTDDELIEVQGSGASAREMGHVPVSGAEGGLRRLAGLRHPRKVFIHINNTNPMLDESGPEYREVRTAGWEIAEDGNRFEL